MSAGANAQRGNSPLDGLLPGLTSARSTISVFDASASAGVARIGRATAATRSRYDVAERDETGTRSTELRRVLLPLALAQFICSFAGSNMNVMINDISTDLDTTVQGVQVAITIFLLVMAALMIPGGKLTDKFGRKRCFIVGLVVYGIGALMSALSPGLGVLIIGNSILERSEERRVGKECRCRWWTYD